MMLLRVLLIEDSDSDARLILHELKKNEYRVELRRVESAAAMRTALEEGEWDLVLADYSVPGFGALPALALLKEQGQDIPFIIVSGTMDEETAVTAMKAGAKDYVMKANLKRLLPAVARELDEAEMRRRQRDSAAEAGRSALKLATVAEMLPDVFFIIDRSGCYQLVNSAFERRFAKRRDSIIGKNCRDVFPTGVAREIERSDSFTLENGLAQRQEYRLKNDGQTVYMDNLKTPLRDLDGSVVGLIGLSRDITEQKIAELELQARLEQLQRAWEQTVLVLSQAVEAKDAYTAGHQRRVAQLAAEIGRRMGFAGDRLTGLTLAALIHDIGKLRIPGELLSKPGRLSEAEYRLIQTHAEAGYEILQQASLPWNIAEIIYQHHEREDGSGYPRQLQSAAILPEAKIIAVADVVEAIFSYRPYRPALGREAALKEIRENRQKLYDAAVVDVCLEIFQETDFQFALEQR